MARYIPQLILLYSNYQLTYVIGWSCELELCNSDNLHLGQDNWTINLLCKPSYIVHNTPPGAYSIPSKELAPIF